MFAVGFVLGYIVASSNTDVAEYAKGADLACDVTLQPIT